ncbi:MAG: TonB-dependent receptor [Pseudomonadota bacterium]
MESHFQKQRVKRLLAIILIGVALPFGGTPARSQEAAELGMTKRINIPAQPLGDALVDISDAFGVSVLTEDAIVRGKQSSVVRGNYSATQALDRILRGTGLAARLSATGSFIIEQVAREDSGATSSLPVRPRPVEEILVKGELLDRTLQNTQTSVVIASGAELERRGDADLYDLIERAPGVGILGGETGFRIRGIGQRGPGGGAGSGLTVSTTVDGETVSNSNRATFLGSYSVWDLDQVEILRGPQSTQTGRNALAGAIILRSNDPVYATEGRVRLEAGSNDTFGGAFVFNAPIIDQKLAIRIAGTSLQSDGEIENLTIGGDANERKDETLRIGLRADFTDRFSAILKHTISDVEAGDDFINLEFGLGARQSNPNFQSERINDKASTNLRLNYEFNPSTRLAWETTRYETDWKFLTDIDGSPTPGGTRLDSANVESIQHEARLHFTNQRVNGVVGAFYVDVDENSVNRIATPNSFLDALLASFGFPGFPIGLPAGSVDNRSSGTGRTENYALFGEFEYQVTPKLDVTIGGRYDWEENGAFDRTSEIVYDPPATEAILGVVGGPSGISVSPDRQTSFEAFLPKLALGYDVNDDVRVGLSVQRGYRPGGSSEAIGVGPYEFDAEYAWNYEFSFRSQWNDDRLTFNANVFRMDWEDQQISQQALPLSFITVNAGESRLYGAELDITARPTDDLELFASMAYVNTEFTDYVVETAGAITDFSGNEFGDAPPITAAFGATKYFPGGWYASADVSYTDEYFTGPGNEESFGNYTLVNARVGYERTNWTVFAYARNLSDKLYQTAGGNITSPGARVGEGRVVGLIAQYSF